MRSATPGLVSWLAAWTGQRPGSQRYVCIPGCEDFKTKAGSYVRQCHWRAQGCKGGEGCGRAVSPRAPLSSEKEKIRKIVNFH